MNASRCALTLGGLLALVPTIALAQDGGGACMHVPTGEIDQVFPGNMETGVPIDAMIRLRFDGFAPADPVVFVTDPGNARVSGTVTVAGNEVHFWPVQNLQPSTQYQVSFNTNPDFMMYAFTTGTQTTFGTPPVFTGLVNSATSARNASSDLCGDPDAVTITLNWDQASALPWAESDVEYVVYETRGPGISGPIERDRERGRLTQQSCNNSEYCPSFRLASTDATGPVCFNVQAIDPMGRSDGNTVEMCVDPTVGNTFNGCAVRQAPTRQRPRLSWFGWLGAAAMIVWAGVRRRGKRS